MGWLKKPKEFFFNYVAIYTPTRIFHLLTITTLTLLLPHSFLLLSSLSGAKFHLQTHSLQPSPYIFSFAIHTSPCILYVLLSIVSVATLINGLMKKNTLLNDSSNLAFLQPCLYISWKWVILCTFQICVGLGIEASIAGEFSSAQLISSLNDYDTSFGVGRSFLRRMIFLLGLHETTQIWSRVVVRPVIDDAVFGVEKRERSRIEKVVVAGSLGLGTLLWWKLRKEVENLGVIKKYESVDVGIEEFVGWWLLYYVTITIGMVRIVKGVMWLRLLKTRIKM